jgi:anti-sigma B factor antagonist
VEDVSPRFEISEESVEDGVRVVAVRGEIHVSTAPELGRHLVEATDTGAGALLLDLSEVEFIDSTGLGVLLNALRRARRRGQGMAIVCFNPTVLRLFEVTRLDDTFDILPTRAKALERLRG